MESIATSVLTLISDACRNSSPGREPSGSTRSTVELVSVSKDPRARLMCRSRTRYVNSSALLSGGRATNLPYFCALYCPECAAGSLDLSTSAFSKIGATSAGKIPISWKFVSCTAAKLTSGKVSVVWYGTRLLSDDSNLISSDSLVVYLAGRLVLRPTGQPFRFATPPFPSAPSRSARQPPPRTPLSSVRTTTTFPLPADLVAALSSFSCATTTVRKR